MRRALEALVNPKNTATRAAARNIDTFMGERAVTSAVVSYQKETVRENEKLLRTVQKEREREERANRETQIQANKDEVRALERTLRDHERQYKKPV